MRGPRFGAGMFLACVSVLVPGAVSAEISTTRQTELLHLLKHDCGSCHGMTLQGGLGPALTPQALSGKPGTMLRDTILHGRTGTPMPPWKAFMTAQEAEWLVQRLQRGTD